ncbi:MAG: short-chain dehydrogenase/reductase [Hyphomonadaceae bacterium]
MKLGLEGKTALITGGSKGIGAAAAKVFAEEGCSVVLIARTQADLTATQQKLAAVANVKVQTMAADLSRGEEVKRVAAAFPEADILVNNAGAIKGGTLLDIDEARWREYWDLKLFGYINMSREYYRLMASRGGGVIINVIGAAANAKPPGYICGAVANSALGAFTQALGSDSPKDGIRVVGIHPGPVDTERLQMLRAQSGNAMDFSAMPFGRAASPEEIGSAVAFLASPRSGYTSGTLITIDAGRSAT